MFNVETHKNKYIRLEKKIFKIRLPKEVINFLYSNLPHGNTIVHSFQDFGHNVM